MNEHPPVNPGLTWIGQVFDALDRVTDHVLAYHPKPKSKAAKKRARKNRKKKRD
jgi:hypothetical protein